MIEAVECARKYGTIVSYDLNYRASLWKSQGGKEGAQKINRHIAQYVDVMIGNEEDFTACLGFEVEGLDEHISAIDPANFKKMIATAVKQFPNFKVAATTLRNAKTASVNDWSAILYAGGEFYQSMMRENLEIYDRVGGGDGFASGLAYGFLEGKGPQAAVEYGAAHGALAMTTPGDTSMVNVAEVEAVMKGKGARTVRLSANASSLDILHHRLLLDLGAVNRALSVGPDAFAAAGAAAFGIGIGVGNEIRHHAVLQAADADAALPAGIVAIAFLVLGFGVGDVQHVIAVDHDAAGPPELGELAQQFAILGEDLDAVVVAVADIEMAFGIHRQAVRHAELARAWPMNPIA